MTLISYKSSWAARKISCSSFTLCSVSHRWSLSHHLKTPNGRGALWHIRAPLKQGDGTLVFSSTPRRVHEHLHNTHRIIFEWIKVSCLLAKLSLPELVSVLLRQSIIRGLLDSPWRTSHSTPSRCFCLPEGQGLHGLIPSPWGAHPSARLPPHSNRQHTNLPGGTTVWSAVLLS